ncbi:PREDICTED: putative nuclease HARBI1, partial [Wasmannia auropunctata]|uniref:putative nuclease HARBI1 n=1 Tax=Wasmannia auropunctata TaxID=64793 RepID=UPI0005ED509D
MFLEPLTYIYDEDNSDILETYHKRILKKNRIPRIEGYVENIISSLSALQFKNNFRMLPSTFEFLLEEIGEKLIPTTEGNEMIPADKQLLLSLWRFATPDSYRSIIERFNVGKATAIRTVRRVAKALCDLSPTYIVWPTNKKIEAIVLGFASKSGFPDTIGVIDGTHIYIPAPIENADAYINRKKRHSIQLQAVCHHTMQFTHIYVGNVGSVHDARVFRLSAVQDYINDPTKFPNNTHIIGDAAYGLHQHLLVPYMDNGHLTVRQENYNYCHSSTRMVIERAFGLLKGRWRSLLHVLAINLLDFTPYHILACCVLHNICLLQKDELTINDVIVLDTEEAELQREDIIRCNDRVTAEAKR